ncbi:hypothetical protein FQZ97_836950 [compost metagenome]
MVEVQVREGLRQRIGLRVDELELVAAFQHDWRGALGADADPVDTGGRLDGAVGFDGHGEAAGVDGHEQERIQLQQGFAAREDHVAVFGAGAPAGRDGVGQQFGRGELAAALAIGADEVGVAEGAGGTGAVAFAARPQVAACKPAEYRRAARMGAFALQRLENFFGGISHEWCRRPDAGKSGKARYFTWRGALDGSAIG